MEKIIILILMFFFYNCSFCQYQTSYVVKDTLFVNFKNEFYSKIANDSIKKIYDQQKRLGVSNGISSKYRFEDLEFKSIPIYTFKKNSYLLYSCKKDILSFIDFENVIIFQKVIIIKGDHIHPKLSEIDTLNGQNPCFIEGFVS